MAHAESTGSIRTPARRRSLRVLAASAPPDWALSLAGPATREFELRSPDSDARLQVRVHAGAEAGLVSVELDDVRSMSPDGFEGAARSMIARGFTTLAATGTPHAVRVWNFLPGIHDPMGPDVDRYRVFNVARHRAFCDLFGEPAVDTGALPTSSCVGHGGSGLALHVLGATRPGEPVENPRQVPAFAYSPKYGPRPPCFARATRAVLGGRSLLLVGGTASVRGEDSVHGGSRRVQLEETVTNLRALVDRGRGGRGAVDTPLMGVMAARVYCKRPDDCEWWMKHLPADLCRGVEVEGIHAEICREELLVEIELVVDLSVL